jgi:hypothetical protein
MEFAADAGDVVVQSLESHAAFWGRQHKKKAKQRGRALPVVFEVIPPSEL